MLARTLSMVLISAALTASTAAAEPELEADGEPDPDPDDGVPDPAVGEPVGCAAGGSPSLLLGLALLGLRRRRSS